MKEAGRKVKILQRWRVEWLQRKIKKSGHFLSSVCHTGSE